MIEAVISVGAVALVSGIGLGFAAKKFEVQVDPLVEKVTAILPGANCGNCGFPGCKGYADALAAGETPVNLCTPGGKATMEELAMLLGVKPAPLGDDLGPKIALIHEENCIGCTACIKACPVDAIIGANKQSHTVLHQWCTGCESCVKPCPVNCIEMVVKPKTLYDWKWPKPVGASVSTHAHIN